MQVDVCPPSSVTVRVTVLAPTLEHVNVDGETDNVTPPLHAEDPLFIWSAVIVAFPLASSVTAKSWQIAVGGGDGILVISWVTLVTLPHSSEILYVLVIISGDALLETSSTKATVGTSPELSRKFVTEVISAIGNSSPHATVTAAGASPVGGEFT